MNWDECVGLWTLEESHGCWVFWMRSHLDCKRELNSQRSYGVSSFKWGSPNRTPDNDLITDESRGWYGHCTQPLWSKVCSKYSNFPYLIFNFICVSCWAISILVGMESSHEFIVINVAISVSVKNVSNGSHLQLGGRELWRKIITCGTLTKMAYLGCWRACKYFLKEEIFMSCFFSEKQYMLI